MKARSTLKAAQEIRNNLLTQVVREVLTSPGLESSRQSYGTPGDKRLALVPDGDVPWPRSHVPSIPGYHVLFRRQHDRPNVKAPHLLAIRIDEFRMPPGPESSGKRTLPYSIAVTMYNIGGHGDQPAMGECTVYYSILSKPDGWRVQWTEVSDR